MSDEGSVLPLVALWLMALVVMAMGLVAGVDVVADRTRAQAAADAGALAGAAEGRSAAEVVVGRNGATLVSYRERVGGSPESLLVVDIVVRFDDVTARASAERYRSTGDDPGSKPGGR
ncbi:MAG: pilus assembly protein TadG-related protein [Acidimicrobiia bacterium]|nr:pilus assembly protein TadG-related protein [Acidimicrobiia bacterium]